MDMPTTLVVNGIEYVRRDSLTREPTEIERWYSVAELADMSGFTPSSIYRAMGDGRLRYKCPNGSDVGRRVSHAEWERFLATT